MPTFHPHLDEHGQAVAIKKPSTPTPMQNWHAPEAVATTVPTGELPDTLNGIPLAPWLDHPTTSQGWNALANSELAKREPALKAAPGMKTSAGVVVHEPDGRVWIVAPTNRFGGYDWIFPKGTVGKGMTLQGTAICETLEESGLQVRITGLLGDFARSTSICRLYLGERIGGSPAAMGWESQAVSLVPLDSLPNLLNDVADQPVIAALLSHADMPCEERGDVQSEDYWGVLHEMPKRHDVIYLKLCFSPEEMERIRRGFQSGDMDDKWFLYFSGDHLYMHRSWSGHLIYDVQFTFDSKGGAYVSEVVVNRDPQQHGNANEDEDRKLLEHVIHYHLLGALEG